jgi:hypothetical protein
MATDLQKIFADLKIQHSDFARDAITLRGPAQVVQKGVKEFNDALAAIRLQVQHTVVS